MKTTVTILILLTVFPLNTFAQDFPDTNLEGHTDTVHSVVFSPDGKILASGSRDKTIRLWDATTGGLIHALSGHTGSVWSVAFSPDGKILASGSGDRTIRLWDATIGKHIRTLRGHMGSVMEVAFSPDGRMLASRSGDQDQTVRLWDAVTGKPIHTLTEHTNSVMEVAFSPDGKILASGSGDRTVRLWDAVTGKPIHTLRGHTHWVTDVAFSPDGKILASWGDGETIRLWDATTGKPIHTFTGRSGGVAFSPDGKILASGSGDRTVRLWDATTGKPIHTLREHTHWVTDVAFSPDGKILASWGGGETIGLWDSTTGKPIHTFTGRSGSDVAFSPDGKILTSWSGASGRGDRPQTIRLWRMPSTHVNIAPDPVVFPAIGEQFTINVSIVSGENVGGYQVSLGFDATVFRYVSSTNGDYLPAGAFFVPPVVSENKVTLGATALAGVSSGDGTLATVTFEVIDVKESVIQLFDTILTDSDGEHLPHLAYSATVIEPSLLPTSAVIGITPSSVLSPAAGEQLTFNVDITGGRNVADFQLTFDYDSSALGSISTSRGNYLVDGVGNGDGTLETVTFEVIEVKASNVSVSGYLIATNGLRYVPTFESADVVVPIFGDVNRDGVVNILDLVQVAAKFGQKVSGDPADVNEDGVVNIVDLVKVAGALGGEAAAPSALYSDLEAMPTRATVQKWLSQAQQLNLTDATSQRGILFLEQLLASLTPKETTLLPNYPNPFNPETWIPYQLAAPADVTVSIYASDGTVVRTLALGHQPIGIYQDKSRAAYWDGKNEVGEPVASSVYFYTLKAGDFTATRKMLIRK